MNFLKSKRWNAPFGLISGSILEIVLESTRSSWIRHKERSSACEWRNVRITFLVEISLGPTRADLRDIIDSFPSKFIVGSVIIADDHPQTSLHHLVLIGELPSEFDQSRFLETGKMPTLSMRAISGPRQTRLSGIICCVL